jgi:hypothetical protein
MISEQDKLIKHISLIKFKDPRVIQSIVYHPMLFAKRKMTDPDDLRPIRIRYFGVFVGKYMRNKEMFKKLSYTIKCIKEHPELIDIFVDPKFDDDREARLYICKLFDTNQKDSLCAIYDAVAKAMEKM